MAEQRVEQSARPRRRRGRTCARSADHRVGTCGRCIEARARAPRPTRRMRAARPRARRAATLPSTTTAASASPAAASNAASQPRRPRPGRAACRPRRRPASRSAPAGPARRRAPGRAPRRGPSSAWRSRVGAARCASIADSSSASAWLRRLLGVAARRATSGRSAASARSQLGAVDVGLARKPRRALLERRESGLDPRELAHRALDRRPRSAASSPRTSAGPAAGGARARRRPTAPRTRRARRRARPRPRPSAARLRRRALRPRPRPRASSLREPAASASRVAITAWSTSAAAVALEPRRRSASTAARPRARSRSDSNRTRSSPRSSPPERGSSGLGGQHLGVELRRARLRARRRLLLEATSACAWRSRAGVRSAASSRPARWSRRAASSATRSPWRRAASAWRSSGRSWRRTSRSRSCRRGGWPRWRQPALGLLLAAPVLQDAGRLLDDQPPVLGPGVEHGVDLALATRSRAAGGRRRCRTAAPGCRAAGTARR